MNYRAISMSRSTTRSHQGRWCYGKNTDANLLHKMANVLNKVALSVQVILDLLRSVLLLSATSLISSNEHAPPPRQRLRSAQDHIGKFLPTALAQRLE
jgi:hypothetical protein